MLAQRMRSFKGSGTAKARAAAKAAKDAGMEVLDLTVGEIWSDPPADVTAGAIRAIESGINRYTDTIGIEPLRTAIAHKVARETGCSWGAEHIAVTAGAKQALFNIALSLFGPGDEIVIPAPYWTTFPAQISLVGAKPVFVDTRDTNYIPSVADVERVITGSTKAIVLNTPNNPTGSVLPRDTLEGLAGLARKHALWIVFDECYAGFVHEPLRHVPICEVAPDLRDRTLLVNSFSKHCALTGWRIGYLAADPAIIKAVKALQSHTTSNPNVIAQHAILSYLEKDDDSFERGLEARLLEARDIGLSVLSGLPSVAKPIAEGGFYFYLDLRPLLAMADGPDAPKNAEDVTELLIREAGVATVPGSAFGDPYGLRLSYGADVDQLKAGLERLVDCLSAFPIPTKIAAAN